MGLPLVHLFAVPLAVAAGETLLASDPHIVKYEAFINKTVVGALMDDIDGADPTKWVPMGR